MIKPTEFYSRNALNCFKSLQLVFIDGIYFVKKRPKRLDESPATAPDSDIALNAIDTPLQTTVGLYLVCSHMDTAMLMILSKD